MYAHGPITTANEARKSIEPIVHLTGEPRVSKLTAQIS
jgi:hypothetical protein